MVQWNADKDQIILKGIFQFHDLKSSAPLLEYLAKEIGEGCTPKAVSHRLNNIRSTGKPVNSSGVTASPAGKATAPKTPKTPKTPRPRKIAATPKSNNKRLATPSDSDQGPESFLDDPELKTPTTASRKRARTTPAKNYAEPDSENAGSPSAGVKKVKIEPFEDESEHDCLTAAEENSMFEV